MASQSSPFGAETSGPSPALPPRPQQPPFFPPPPSAPVQYGGQQDSTSNQSATSSKPGMRDRLYQLSVKAGAPINRLTHKLGSEAFWPSSLDQESNKAARILRSFCRMLSLADAPLPRASCGLTD